MRHTQCGRRNRNHPQRLLPALQMKNSNQQRNVSYGGRLGNSFLYALERMQPGIKFATRRTNGLGIWTDWRSVLVRASGATVSGEVWSSDWRVCYMRNLAIDLRVRIDLDRGCAMRC